MMRNQNIFIFLFALLTRECFSFVSNQDRRPPARSRTSTENTAPLLYSHAPYRDDDDGVSPTFGEAQDNRSYYLATCIPGLSDVLAQELLEFGCTEINKEASSAVSFAADTRAALTALLWSRTTHKLSEFLCSSEPDIQNRDDLASYIRNAVPVQELLGNGSGGLLTLAVSVTLNQASKIPQDIRHSHFTALTVKNALCDSVRDLRGDRPSVELDDPDVPLTAVLLGTDSGVQLSLFRQLHGGSLHKRGYRTGGGTIHKAAMKESLAAGLLLHGGWKEKCDQVTKGNGTGSVVLMDPMCGSGSLPIEAAMIAADLAPGIMRIRCGLKGHNMPAILRWKQEDKEGTLTLWRELLLDATSRAKQGLQVLRGSGAVQIIGNDLHSGALTLFESSLEQAGLTSIIQVCEGNCEDFEPGKLVQSKDASWTVVCNPPWGVRLSEDIHESWESLRFLLRDTCPPGTTAWVLSGAPELTKHLGLRKSQSLPIKTGTQDLRWIQYLIRARPPPGTQGKEEELAARLESKLPERQVRQRRADPRSRAPQEQRKKRKQTKTVTTLSDTENEWLI